MNNSTALAPVLTTTLLTLEQKTNFVDFWTAQGWTLSQCISKLVLANSVFEKQVTDLYNTLKPSAELPVGTVNAVLATIENAKSIDGYWEWQGGYNKPNRTGYGIASIYKEDGSKSSIVATRLMYRLVTGYAVQPRRIEVLDHLNHNPLVCTDYSACKCIRSCNPVQLALVTQDENLLRSNSHSGAFYAPKAAATHCPEGHDKNGFRNCPTCKAEYDRNRYAARKSGLLVAA